MEITKFGTGWGQEITKFGNHEIRSEGVEKCRARGPSPAEEHHAMIFAGWGAGNAVLRFVFFSPAKPVYKAKAPSTAGASELFWGKVGKGSQ